MTDPADQAAADRLDAEIEALLAGRPDPPEDRARLWLASALRAPVPGRARRRVDARLRAMVWRRWRWARLATALLGGLFVASGLGSLVAGRWVAAGLGEPYGPHVAAEGGLAALAVGVVALVCATRHEWLPVAVVAVVPLALVAGVSGPAELGTFAWGAALHLGQGAVAVVVVVTVAVARAGRYRRPPRGEPPV